MTRREKIFWVAELIFAAAAWVCTNYIHPVRGKMIWYAVEMYGFFVVLLGIWNVWKWAQWFGMGCAGKEERE